jgi:hypothetical protein
MATSATVECQFYSNPDSDTLQSYQVAPLTIQDIAQINLRVRAELIRAARLSLEGCQSETEADQVLFAAMKQAAAMSILGEGNYFRSIDGASQIFYQSLKKDRKDLTLDDVVLLVSDSRNAEEIGFALQVMRRALSQKEIRESRVTAANPTVVIPATDTPE